MPQAGAGPPAPVRKGTLMVSLLRLIRALVGVLLLSATAAQAGPIRYSMTILGTLGGRYSQAWGINDHGQVVGYSDLNASRYPIHAFLWTRGSGMQDLGTLGGGVSWAFGINENGQVVGGSGTAPYGAEHAFLWTRGVGMQDLGGGSARDINDRGEITGGTVGGHAALWTSGAGMQDLGTLGGLGSNARAINNHGQVVGSSNYIPNDSSDGHAYLWTRGAGMQDLGTLGGRNSEANDINEHGQAVGGADIATDHDVLIPHAFLWTSGAGMQDLGTLGGTDSFAVAINDRGQVIGSATTASGEYHPFLWTSRDGMQDLTTLLPLDDGWGHLYALDINNAGQIVGLGTRGRHDVAFLLTPVPEPSACALLSLGLAGLAWIRIRRGWDRCQDGRQQ